jgi:hypothetical protein
VPSVFPRLRPAAPGPGRGAAGPIPGPAHSPGRSRSPPAETAPALAGIPLPRQVLRQQRLEGLRRVLRKVETAALVCDDAAVFQWVARWLSLCWVSCSPASRQKPVHRLPSVWPRSSGRTIDFRVRRLRRPEHVPLPVDRVDQANGVAVVHLLTKLPDADGDGVRITLVVLPDPLLDILAREHPSLVAGERLQERILPRRERGRRSDRPSENLKHGLIGGGIERRNRVYVCAKQPLDDGGRLIAAAQPDDFRRRAKES